MAELSYTGTNNTMRRTDWAAVWAGVFTFAAIWSIFELLGMAIFSGATQSPATGANVGMFIWTIVLTLIAMYVAGRETGRLAVLADRGDGVIHGMIMFGLSLIAALVLAALANGAGVHNSLSAYLENMSPAARWTGFLSLLLGWLAAMGGAASSPAPRKAQQQQQPAADNVRDMRPAA